MKNRSKVAIPSQKSRYANLLWLWTTLSLLCILLLSAIINPLLTFLSFSADQPLFNSEPPFVVDSAHDANYQHWRKLFTGIPAVNRSPTLTLTNYAEDRAVREAML